MIGAVTGRELNRATLARQGLLRRERVDVVDAVARVVGLQAQSPPSPYLALWNRVEGFDPEEVDAAFADGRLVKATLMRQTLHAVDARDHATFRSAMLPTLRSRVGDPRFTRTGLDVERLDALVAELPAFAAGPRRPAEIEAWIAERTGVEQPRGIWWLMRFVAPLAHAPTGPPWTFAERPAYRWLGGEETDPEAALRDLARRYLAAFGPATAADFAQFAMVQRARARVALEGLGLEGPSYDLPDAPRPDADTPAPPRLLGMWDNLLLAHADRRRVIAPEHRAAVTRRNGDVLPTLLVDGFVAGVWRALDGAIEATAFRPLDEEAWAGLAEEAESLRGLLAPREPTPYRRHHAWFADLPAAEVRRL
jgi:hypothetical protein